MGTTLIATSTPRMTYRIGMRVGIGSLSDKMALWHCGGTVRNLEVTLKFYLRFRDPEPNRWRAPVTKVLESHVICGRVWHCNNCAGGKCSVTRQ
jgi:hypothetical protein